VLAKEKTTTTTTGSPLYLKVVWSFSKASLTKHKKIV
jgi:hypothetical protein